MFFGIERLQPKNWPMNIANGKTSTKVLNGVDGSTRKIVDDKYGGLEMNDDLKELLKKIEKKEYESLDLPLMTGDTYGWSQKNDYSYSEE